MISGLTRSRVVHQNFCAALKQPRSGGELRVDEAETVSRNAFYKNALREGSADGNSSSA
jgi:hypothetical protein